jgi:6-phosphogluconolactonase (cycloisomerase 2 family)
VTQVAGDRNSGFRIALTYDDATTVLFPLSSEGGIEPPADVVVHHGDGGPLQRQTHPQLHAVSASPSGEVYLVTDKGNDRVCVFKIDRTSSRLIEAGPGHAAPPGSSPRYFAWHPSRPFVYLNHETQSIVTVLRYAEDGALDPIGSWSALPERIDDGFEMKQSDIRVHPSGRYLYTGIRGISSITVFVIDDDGGSLRWLQTAQLDGIGPRAFAFSPDGRFLVIAALDSREVLVWNVHDDGTISSTGQRYPQPNPGTVTFA